MPESVDGPVSSHFHPVRLTAEGALTGTAESGLSDGMKGAFTHAPGGECVGWGIPFSIGSPVIVTGAPVTLAAVPFAARWLVFMHAADTEPLEPDPRGFLSPMTGEGGLGKPVFRYTVRYADGSAVELELTRRREIGSFTRRWGENCFECVSHRKPRPNRAHHEQPARSWGVSQTRADSADDGPWTCWLWAWENPRPDAEITGLTLVPAGGKAVFFGLSAGNVSSRPLRWETRRKAIVRLPTGERFDPRLDDRGILPQISIDMGQVISAEPRRRYPNPGWTGSDANALPDIDGTEILVEYTAHPDAALHLPAGTVVPLTALAAAGSPGTIVEVPRAEKRVVLKTVTESGGPPVPVKLHVHGCFGEYLAPVDRHRIPNGAWFEDYGADFLHRDTHLSTYIGGTTVIDLPLGKVFVEITKGFEIRPVRLELEIGSETDEVVIELDKVLPWREKGWVTADTHVHFLSPVTALLEGSAEGVNVVNLLASQWGELMTNVGDFDGRTVWGSREAGGDGEHLVRVGTENRQHVLGHISLLGYSGRIIAPMTTGGPDESALGDPVGVLLTEWAEQCRRQGGLVILPHFPNPRAENAAVITEGLADGVEMTSWGNLYGGIDPYSLSDWYRYLNCGYPVAAVGGTDKMSAGTPVGAVRTYARIPDGQPFTYAAWMDAVRRMETFVTYGPLMELTADGAPIGGRIPMKRGGGTVDVVWECASVTVPMSRVELVVNGEIRESAAVEPDAASGSWNVKIDRSSWLALMIRGSYPGKPEIIAAHSSPVMVEVDGSEYYAEADAVTILDQIEGSLAYLDTVGTRAETEAYRRMRLTLTSAHRRLHNRMHRLGHYHEHTHAEDHPEHH